MHNVLKSNAAYPILMRRPWNQSATGMLAVNNYEEFLKLLEVISTQYAFVEGSVPKADIVVLVGPSGSGKTKIAKILLEKSDAFGKLVSYTTNDPTALKANDWYTYISKQQFFEMLDEGYFFESTMYAGHGFGSKKADVDTILSMNKIVLATMDICGAMSLKTNYKNVTTIYIKRDRRELLASILRRNCSDDDKVNRIISIDDEKRNEEICDYVVSNNGYEQAADEIIDLLNLKRHAAICL